MAKWTARWVGWNDALLARSGEAGLKLKKPVRRSGTWMTVAVLDMEYRQADDQGILDLDQPAGIFREAEELMDAAGRTV